MANPLGGASRLTLALTIAVAVAVILGTIYVCLVAVGEPMLRPPLNVLLFVALSTVITTLAQAWHSSKIRDELASLRRELDERDGKIYAALARRSSTEITAEIPRPRVVASVPAVVGLSSVVEMPSPTTVEAMKRLARRVTES